MATFLWLASVRAQEPSCDIRLPRSFKLKWLAHASIQNGDQAGCHVFPIALSMTRGLDWPLGTSECKVAGGHVIDARRLGLVDIGPASPHWSLDNEHDRIARHRKTTVKHLLYSYPNRANERCEYTRGPGQNNAWR